MRTLILLLLTGLPAVAQSLTDETFEKWRSTIRPEAGELKWTKVPWRATFWDAVKEGNATDKPVLLWAMNGHPLALT